MQEPEDKPVDRIAEIEAYIQSHLDNYLTELKKFLPIEFGDDGRKYVEKLDSLQNEPCVDCEKEVDEFFDDDSSDLDDFILDVISDDPKIEYIEDHINRGLTVLEPNSRFNEVELKMYQSILDAYNSRRKTDE